MSVKLNVQTSSVNDRGSPLKFHDIFFVKERQWTGIIFFLFFCVYLIMNLCIALPEGSRTTIVSYGIPNLECVKTPTGAGLTKTCSSTLRMTAKSTAQDYLHFFGPGDPASYASGGLALAGKEWGSAYHTAELPLFARLKLMNLIGYGMWPPGMYFLNALPLMINTDVPLGLYQVVAASTLWAIAFALIASLLILRTRLWFAVLVPIFLMSFPLFHDYLMRYGAMYSETYGAAFMAIGFSFLAFFYYRKPSSSLMVIAGLCFAAASFFRSQMFPVSVGVSAILAALCFMHMRSENTDKSVLDHGLKSTVIFLLAFYLPIGSYMAFNKGKLFDVPSVWTAPFSVPAFPDAGVANFLALGGMRAACVVDMKKCEHLKKQIKSGIVIPHARTEVLKSFMFHPIDFSLYKLPIAWRFWMENSGPSESVIIYRYDSILMLAILFVCLVYMLIRKLWLFFWCTFASVGLVFGPPFLLHFEVRYFYLTKVFILFLPFWLLFASQHVSKRAMEVNAGDEVGLSS